MNNNYFSLEYYRFANVGEIIVFVKSIIIFVGSIGKSDTSLWDLIYNVGAGCRWGSYGCPVKITTAFNVGIAKYSGIFGRLFIYNL